MGSYITLFGIHFYAGLLSIFSWFLLSFAPKGKMAVRFHIKERCRPPFPVRDYRNREVFWLHAASVGECKLMLKFLGLLRKNHPDSFCVVTATTETGVKYLQQNRDDAMCAIGYLPLDTPAVMEKLLLQYRIKRVWLLETEIWPGLLWACMRRDIPVGIVNGRIEEKSFKTYRMLGSVLKTLFASLDTVLAQSEQYSGRFKALGVRPSRICVVGNLKSRVIVERPPMDRWQSIRDTMKLDAHDVVITMGCVHTGEAYLARRAIDALNQRDSGYKWIIVPRHIEKTDQIAEALPQGTLRLKEEKANREWSVCIVDKMGVLEDMYCIADAAVIGGTFVDVGGHNVWEAAQFGIPVFFGPDYHTQVESCEQLRSAGVGFKVSSPDDLADEIIRIMKVDARQFIAAQCKFREDLHRGLEELEELIP